MYRKEVVRDIFILSIILVLLVSPQLHSFVINQTFNKSLYPNGTLIITTTPTATFPSDWSYCYLGDNNLDAVVIYYNMNDTGNFITLVNTELQKCDITINWQFHNISEDRVSYFDYEFENNMNFIRTSSNADLVIVFADLIPPIDSVYEHLGGYSRVQSHFAVVFTPQLAMPSYSSAIALHELAHCLGYWHSNDNTDVMYPTFYGDNIHFNQQTIDDLYELHH